MKCNFCIASLCFFLVALFAAPPCEAEGEYPDKPVKIIVPFAAGGLFDVVARAVASEMQRQHGQPFVVENKPGANTRIAAEACAGARHDGYTLCVLSTGSMSINPQLYGKLGYSVEHSFAPISNLVIADLMLAVQSDLPVRSWFELVAYSRSHPGKVAYASFGVGSDVHLTMEHLRRSAGADFLHVPFNGYPPMLQALGSGDVQVMLLGTGNPGVVDLVKSGKLKAIALRAPRRSVLLPDVPTFAEAGLPKVEALTWFGLFAPAETPKRVVSMLSADVVEAFKTKELAERLRSLGVTPVASSPEEFESFLVQDRRNWKSFVQGAGFRLAD